MPTTNEQRAQLSTWHRDAVRLHRIHEKAVVEVGWDDELNNYVILGSFTAAEPAPPFDLPDSLRHIRGIDTEGIGVQIVRPRPVDPATLPALRPSDFLRPQEPDTETGSALQPATVPGALPTEYSHPYSEPTYRFPCNRCERSFPSGGSLLRHSEVAHGDPSPWQNLTPDELAKYQPPDTAALARVQEQVLDPSGDDVAPHVRESAGLD